MTLNLRTTDEKTPARKAEAYDFVKIEGKRVMKLKAGYINVKADPGFTRSTEVKTLLGDLIKANEKLGCQPLVGAVADGL